MFECIDGCPSERIRVFISSAQDDEDGFVWSDVRKKIKLTLSKCAYLNPFIIEDEASPKPSLQFFQRQIERADAIIFLIKGVVRGGTMAEYSHAVSLNKPLFVYFQNHENPNISVIKLKKDIQTYDRCTYKYVGDFDSIEKNVWNDLMNSIVRSFQDGCSYLSVDTKEHCVTELPKEHLFSNQMVLSNTELKKFGSCYNYLFDLLKYNHLKKDVEESEFHSFGCALIRWLMTGEWDISDKEVDAFILGCDGVYSKTEWIKKRWNAIQSFIKGDIPVSLSYEKEALSIAKQESETTWIINDILIDCRNLENDMSYINKQFLVENEYQNEIDNQNYLVFVPVLDRYLTSVYEQIDKDRFRVETASPGTHLFGTGFSSAVKELVNYLFSAAIYGSNTHCQIVRKRFAFLLIEYAKITGEDELAFDGLKQFILFGDNDNYKLFLKSSWDKLYSFIATKADELWKLIKYVPIQYRDRMKKDMISTIGLYFSDDIFLEAEEYIYNCSSDVYWGNSEDFFDAILNTLGRLNPERVIKAIIPIVAERRFSLGNKLSHIILYIDLKQVSDNSLMELAQALEKQLAYIVSHNGDPQMIAPLVERSCSIFKFLESMQDNGLNGLQLLLYKINTGTRDWVQVLKGELESAKAQFEANKKDGVFYDFRMNPYEMISYIIRKESQNIEINDILQDELIPLSIDILNSQVAIKTKETCVACLCDLLSLFNNRKEKIPKELIKAIQSIDLKNGDDPFIFGSQKSLEIRILMARILCGILEENSILQWCVDFNNLKVNERIVLIDCIEKFLFYQHEKIDLLIISIVLQCSSDDNPNVRGIAYRCMSYIIANHQDDTIERFFCNGIFDPSAYVRSTILSVCKNDVLSNSLSTQICELLCNDANYTIRKRASNLLEHLKP